MPDATQFLLADFFRWLTLGLSQELRTALNNGLDNLRGQTINPAFEFLFRGKLVGQLLEEE
jgi:hypothetical protein